MKPILKTIAGLGIVFSHLLLADLFLPPTRVETTVLDKDYGWEERDRKNRGLSYLPVKLESGHIFPNSRDLPVYFQNGDEVVLYISQIFRMPAGLAHTGGVRPVRPIKGIFSIYRYAAVLLAIVSWLAVYFRQDFKKMQNCCIFTAFLIALNLIVVFSI